MTRCLAILLLLPLGCRPKPRTPAGRAVGWLMAQQQGDLWRSKTYSGVLGSGEAMTPFVLYALSHAPAEELAPHRAGIDRALDRLPLPGGELPNYSLALSILALKRLRPSADTGALERELRRRQFVEEWGWTEADPEYGGWDHGNLEPRKGPPHRPDLSVTALAVEALGGDAKARRFAERCRASDGGFFFTPNPAVAFQNKGGEGRSYATATCDALRILGADERGLAWLDRHGGGDLPHGLSADWAEALRFYFAYARSKVRPGSAAGLARLQRGDGSWANPAGLMKEDDPLIATGLALIAVARE